jgi:hypothetical protein
MTLSRSVATTQRQSGGSDAYQLFGCHRTTIHELEQHRNADRLYDQGRNASDRVDERHGAMRVHRGVRPLTEV